MLYTPDVAEIDFHRWTSDNERLVLAGLQNTNPGPLDYDETTLDAVRQRCIRQFGRVGGAIYFLGLMQTLPDRHKDLFPGIYSDPEEK